MYCMYVPLVLYRSTARFTEMRGLKSLRMNIGCRMCARGTCSSFRWCTRPTLLHQQDGIGCRCAFSQDVRELFHGATFDGRQHTNTAPQPESARYSSPFVRDSRRANSILSLDCHEMATTNGWFQIHNILSPQQPLCS